ncbi:hypothetical protein PQR53_01615 [Paraburkholderia fungorum]|uniref:hypothetical protein n=1 Tax=Paraburkholderia fungorum TaxID=134537 RepID=UPI0038BB1C9E
MNRPIDPPFVVPDGWGSDELSKFDAYASQSRFSVYSDLPEWHWVLSDIATDMESLSLYLLSRIGDFSDVEGPLLLATSRTQFLAAASMLTSGHVLASHAIGRTVVESALYGWYLLICTGSAERWRTKPLDKTARRNWGREFSFSALTRKLKEYDETAASIALSLHQRAIDFGGHPNVTVLGPNLHVKSVGEGQIEIRLAILHGRSGPWVDAFELVAKSGAFAMLLFAYAFCDYEEGATALHAAFRYMEKLKDLLDKADREWA